MQRVMMGYSSNHQVSKDTIIIVANDLDESDLLAITGSLRPRKNALLICDHGFLREHPEKDICCIGDNFRDAARLVRKLKALQQDTGRRYRGIIGLDEEFHYRISRQIADEFSLRYYPTGLLDVASNKYLQLLGLNNAGIRVPEFELVTKRSTLAFPNVLKIITGCASSFAFVNKDEAEFRKNIAYIRNSDETVLHPHIAQGKVYDPKRQFIVQEFVPGEEYSCDFLVQGDRVCVLRVVKKLQSRHFGFFDGFYLFKPHFLEKIENLCRDIARALGIMDGVSMLDFRVHNNTIYVLETSIRPGIDSFIDLMHEVYHYTSINKLMEQRLGNNAEIAIPDRTGLLFFFTAPHQGRLKVFDTTWLDKNRNELGMVKTIKSVRPGEVIRKRRKHDYVDLMLGYAVLRDVDDPAAAMENIKNHVIIQVER